MNFFHFKLRISIYFVDTMVITCSISTFLIDQGIIIRIFNRSIQRGKNGITSFRNNIDIPYSFLNNNDTDDTRYSNPFIPVFAP